MELGVLQSLATGVGHSLGKAPAYVAASAATPLAAAGQEAGRLPGPAAIDLSTALARADGLAMLAGDLRALGLGRMATEDLAHKLYPPYPPEQRARIQWLNMNAGLRLLDTSLQRGASDAVGQSAEGETQVMQLGRDLQKRLATSVGISGLSSQGSDRLQAITLDLSSH